MNKLGYRTFLYACKHCLLVGLSLGLLGCATSGYERGSQTDLGVSKSDESTQQVLVPEYVRNLPKSRTGNMKEYTVFGKKYRVMDSAENFTETGDASWYGTKFHGRKTSSGEIYDMYAMTAAHKHIPIPTYARVTNLNNNKSIIVKINDRGPFVGDRIIDLSYAAAIELDMAEQGIAPVEVVGLSTHLVAENEPTALSESGRSAANSNANAAMEDGFVESNQEKYVIQLGAFSSAPNAHNLVSTITERAGLRAYVEQNADSTVFRVKLGPFVEGEQLDKTLEELASVGIDGYTLQAASR